ncbi:MAG: hypothetical protein IKA02_05300, partial [Clostridia bacterium]|nr:hypothetical protein [Clostridia bacterium]
MKKLLLSFIIILSILMLFSCQKAENEVISDANGEKQPIDLDNGANANDIKNEAQTVSAEKNDENLENDAQASKENDVDKVAKDGNENLNEDKSSEKEQVQNEFILKAIVKKVENDRIEVEVIESDYAFGIYWILTSNTTKYYNDNGSIINRQNIKIGDAVEISYSGQTMLSYP